MVSMFRQILKPLTASAIPILVVVFGPWAARAPAQAPIPPPQTATAKRLSLDDIFPNDHVLEVRITLAEKDWDTIRHQSRGFLEVLQEKRKYAPIDSPYTYVDASVTIDGATFPKVGLRKKGLIGSQSSSRPSLKIKLNHFDEDGEIEGLTNLTFNNNKQDPTLVSQFMGYAMFNAADSPAPRCAYANVTVNGKHLGIYSHVETIRKSSLKRRFGSDAGVLYEGTIVDFHEGWEGSFERKFGDDTLGREKIKQLIRAMQGKDVSEDTEQAIGQLVDLDSFFRFWAVEGLLGSWDGYTGNSNNFLVYLNPATDKFHFMPWGADAVFEKFSKLGYDPQAPTSVKTKGMVAHKLYQLESNRARYAKTLMNLLEEHWDEQALLAETDRIQAMLEPHLAPSQRGLGAALERVRKFIRTRREELLAEISDGMPVWARVPEPPPVIPGDFARGRDRDSIWYAAKTGDIQAIQQHLAQGANVDDRNAPGATPLSMAALAGHTETVRFLIGKGADVDAKNNDGHTALHGAAFLGQLDVVQLLVANQANLNARNNDGNTPLDSSAAGWNDEVQGLVQFIATILQVDVELEEVKAGRPRVAKLLRERGGKLSSDLPKPTGRNIWESAKLGHLDALREHLAKDAADVNTADEKGITPLSWAAMAGQVEAVELLIAEGADVNARNRDGGVPLHGASFLGNLRVVELLLQNKADVNVKNLRGETPLGSVDTEWNEGMEGIIQFVAMFLKINVDVEQVKSARPKVAALLRKHGGQTSQELE